MEVSALADTKAVDVIEIDSLSYKYPKGPAYSLKDINFRVDSPRFVAIMGPTGAGKTTLAMTLNGLIPQLFEGELAGYVSVMGMNTQRFRVQTLVSKVGLVLQDPETQIFGITVKEDVAFGPGNMGLDTEEIQKRIDDSLRIVRLTGYEDRFTGELSGGEKQRLAIAGILAMHPEVLVLDEPTSELDPLGREEIYQAIDNLQRERDLTILAVEHSSEDVAERADEVIVVNSGAIVWRGRPRDLFCDVPLTREFGIRPPQVCEFGWRLHELGYIKASDVPLTIAETSELVRTLLSGPPNSQTTRPVEWAPPVTQASSSVDSTLPSDTIDTITPQPAAVLVEDLEHNYGNVKAIRGVNLKIDKGEFMALIGQNGAGKTTLVKHFNNLLRPTHGKVCIDGIDTASQTIGSLSRRVGYVFQNPDHQIFCSTVKEEVGYGLRHLDLSEAETEERVETVLNFVNLQGVADRHPFTLGKGERQRLAVASVLVMQPNILVIDEPTTGQDWIGAKHMMSLVSELHKRGHTIIMITHDMHIVAEYAERVVVMHGGRVVADGTPSEVFSKRDVLRAAYLTPPQISLLATELEDLGMSSGITTVDEAVAIVSEAIERGHLENTEGLRRD